MCDFDTKLLVRAQERSQSPSAGPYGTSPVTALVTLTPTPQTSVQFVHSTFAGIAQRKKSSKWKSGADNCHGCINVDVWKEHSLSNSSTWTFLQAQHALLPKTRRAPAADQYFGGKHIRQRITSVFSLRGLRNCPPAYHQPMSSCNNMSFGSKSALGVLQGFSYPALFLS